MGFLTFQHESASAYLDFHSIDLALLCNVEAEMPGLGDGSGLMKKICAFADRNDMAIFLRVMSEGKDGYMNDEQLVKWYEKFGFKCQPNPEGMPPQMIRYPKEIPSAFKTTFSAWFRSSIVPETGR